VVEQIADTLKFPEVDFTSFLTTMTLMDQEGLDPETQTRIRYHTKATLSRGSYYQARETLKKDFYGPRIVWYQKYFNCSTRIFAKRALKSIQDLHQAIKTSNSVETLKAAVTPFWTNSAEDSDHLITSSEEYFNTFKSLTSAPKFQLEISPSIELFVLPDLRVISAEDIWAHSLLDSQILTRIVIYQLNEFGKIISARLYDQSLTKKENYNAYYRAAEYYYDILQQGPIDRLRPLYSKDPVLEDPTGYEKPRTFDSVYTNFYKMQKEFVYKRSAQKSYVLGNQVAYVVDASFVLTNGMKLTAHPIQIYTFNEKFEITHFEAFFRPKEIDFSKLK